MKRLLLFFLLTVFGFLISSANTDSLLVQIQDGSGEKIRNPFMTAIKQAGGIVVVGYCENSDYVFLIINRSVHPTDAIIGSTISSLFGTYWTYQIAQVGPNGLSQFISDCETKFVYTNKVSQSDSNQTE